MPLHGKTIFISGAAQRIGRHIALSLAQDGADIVIHYHESEQEAAQVAAQIEALGRKAHLIQGDLRNPEEAQQIFEKLMGNVEIFGLIHNASIFLPYSFQSTDLAVWQDHLNVNLTSPFVISQAFARLVPAFAEGRIINLLDWRALRPGDDHFPYTISKAALAALTRSMAVALAPRITVNAIAFGAILPPSDGGKVDSILNNVPARRWADLVEVDQTIKFLLSGPSYITGEIIHLDGGRHLI